MAENEDGFNEQTPKDLRDQLKKAKARAAEADELRREVERLRQDALIRDTGLALSDKQRAALLAVHDGELTSDALKTTASALWPQAPSEPQRPDPSLAVHERIASAVDGSDLGSPDQGAEREAKMRAFLAAGDEKGFDDFLRSAGVAVAQET